MKPIYTLAKRYLDVLPTQLASVMMKKQKSFQSDLIVLITISSHKIATENILHHFYRYGLKIEFWQDLKIFGGSFIDAVYSLSMKSKLLRSKDLRVISC